MPSWYFEKKEIKNTPSYLDGLDTATEARYRREGARFINDAGTKLGLRYDTCATGVVYFHRFYMFHSFKEFPRHVTAACCLFLAGKVEETPKKCKDIIKISQQLLTPKQFSVFGNDPREEVMTLERILLQTIKFDLQTEHPYAYLLKFAKCFKADKEKAQKLVQMAWTFINDSLCTTLCLQWEPEIIAVALMYLGTRLNKFDITEWTGKVPGSKQKWWEFFIEDITVELMEDVCHQVLDLYSPANQAASNSGESPPPPPPVQPQSASRTPNSQASDRKRSLQSTPSDPVTPGGQSSKSMKIETVNQSKKSTPLKSSEKGRAHAAARATGPPPAAQTAEPVPTQVSTQVSSATVTSGQPSVGQDVYGMNPPNPQAPATSYPPTGSSQYPTATASTTEYSQYNPYVSASQYQSSFLSHEGAQNLQSIMGTQPAFSQQPPAQAQYAAQYTQPPPPGAPTVSATATSAYGVSSAQQQQYPPGYNPSQYPASAAIPGPVTQNTFGPGQTQSAVSQQQAPPSQQPFAGTSYQQYSQYPAGYQQGPPAHSQHAQQPGYDQQGSHSQYKGGGSYSGAPSGPRPRGKHGSSRHHQPRSSSALATVRITGR